MNIDELTKRLTDEGKIIESGWAALQALTLAGAPDIQVAEMRKAFFCGAQHLYASIMTILEPGEEPTDNDLARMGLIAQELRAFELEVTSVHKPGRG